MKTEELLRYQAEYKAMQEVLRTPLLAFDFPKRVDSSGYRERLSDRRKNQEGSSKDGL